LLQTGVPHSNLTGDKSSAYLVKGSGLTHTLLVVINYNYACRADSGQGTRQPGRRRTRSPTAGRDDQQAGGHPGRHLQYLTREGPPVCLSDHSRLPAIDRRAEGRPSQDRSDG